MSRNQEDGVESRVVNNGEVIFILTSKYSRKTGEASEVWHES